MSVKFSEFTAGGALAGTEKIVGVDGSTNKSWTPAQLKTYSLASPALTGTPTTPTAAPGTDTTQVASTAFVGAAVAAAVTGLLEFKGSTNCSGNPNYPAASAGDAYVVSTAGKIGGASGVSVDIGDVYVASADNAGGTQAAVGSSWFVLEHNLAGALLAANNLSDVTNAGTARTNLGLAIGTDVQAYSAALALYSAISPSANVQSLLGAADYAAIRTLLGLVIGTNVQAYDAELAALAGLTSVADKVPYFTGSGTAAVADFNALGRSLVGAASARAACAAIGAPYILAQSGAAVSHTGDTSVTTLATITIPANALGPNGQVEIILLFEGTNNANNKTIRVTYNGAVNFANYTFTTLYTQESYVRFANANATNAQVGRASGAPWAAIGAAKTTSSVDTTASTNITITGQLANGADTITLVSYVVKLTYGA